MRALSIWKAEVRSVDGTSRQAWYGRVREGGKHRYFGPCESRLVLVHTAYKHYEKQSLKTDHKPEWDDIGPPGWDATKAWDGVYA